MRPTSSILLLITLAATSACTGSSDDLALPDPSTPIYDGGKPPSDAGPPPDSGPMPAGPPDVSYASCSGTYQNGPVIESYAEHEYPGQSSFQLAGIITMGQNINPPIAGYNWTRTNTFITENKAAVYCGPFNNPTFSQVMFVLPQWQ